MDLNISSKIFSAVRSATTREKENQNVKLLPLDEKHFCRNKSNRNRRIKKKVFYLVTVTLGSSGKKSWRNHKQNISRDFLNN